MKCGKCKEDHETVAEVRACYGAAIESEAMTTVHGKRDGQYELIQKLLAERDIAPLPAYDEIKAKITKREASDMIAHLINKIPRSSVALSIHGEPGHGNGYARTEPDVPAGYYATPSLTGNNDLDFWHVDRPTEGKWAGYTFVKRVIGGRDDAMIPRNYKKRVKTERIRGRVDQLAALDAIRAYGVYESNMLFGSELKYCRKCGIHLTDDTSRELGIGPVCRGK